jgi:peptidyl-tRNA hydrolase ICT1
MSTKAQSSPSLIGIVSTKAQVRFRVVDAAWLPDHVKHKLAINERNRINRLGELVLSSDETRSQQRNLDDCIAKLHTMVLEAAHVPKEPDQETLARVERLVEVDKKRSKDLKQKHSQKKTGRRWRSDD